MDPRPHPSFDRLVPVAETYCVMPIENAFNWADCVEPETTGEWYMVCFRSVRTSDADEILLNELDEAAHREAERAPGFVHYFKGEANSTGGCLSFCFWESRALARAAAARPLHSKATTITNQMYDSYRLEFYRVTKRAGSPTLEFEPYDGPSAATIERGRGERPSVELTLRPSAAST